MIARHADVEIRRIVQRGELVVRDEPQELDSVTDSHLARDPLQLGPPWTDAGHGDAKNLKDPRGEFEIAELISLGEQPSVITAPRPTASPSDHLQASRKWEITSGTADYMEERGKRET